MPSDNEFALYHEADHTKLLVFDLAALATNRVFTIYFPAFTSTSATVALLDGLSSSQVWTSQNEFQNATSLAGDAGMFSLVDGFSGFVAGIIADLSANRNITLPDGTGTLPLLQLAQTFTKAQQIATDSDVVGLKITSRAGAVLNALEVYGVDAAGSVFTVDPAGIVAAGGNVAAPNFALQALGGSYALLIQNKSAISATRTYSIDNTITNTDFAMTGGTQTLSSKTITTLKVATTVSGMPMISGNGADPPASNFMGKVAKTAQAAAIAATNLTDTCPAGLYEVSYYLSTTTANVTDTGVVAFVLGYTDRVGATTQTTAATLALAATTTGTTALKGTAVLYMASGNLQYSTTVTGTQTTSRYSVDARCKYLG